MSLSEAFSANWRSIIKDLLFAAPATGVNTSSGAEMSSAPKPFPSIAPVDAFSLVSEDLAAMTHEIHAELEEELTCSMSSLSPLRDFIAEASFNIAVVGLFIHLSLFINASQLFPASPASTWTSAPSWPTCPSTTSTGRASQSGRLSQ